LTFLDWQWPEGKRGRYSGITCQLIPEKATSLALTLGSAARLLCDPEFILCEACVSIY